MMNFYYTNEENKLVNMTTRFLCCIFAWRNQVEVGFGARAKSLNQMLGLFLAITFVCFVETARAGIANAPLFTAPQVAPNVFFMLDDSGSMDWTILSKKYWEPCAYDPDSGADVDQSNDCGNLVENGEMRSYGTQ